jgi:hypothetical protein
MLKIVCNPPATFKSLGNLHFDNLNKKVKSGKRKGLYYVDSVIYKLEAAINAHQGEQKRFFEYLKGPGYLRLRGILSGKPEMLKHIINDFHRKFPTLTFRHINGNNQDVFNPLGEVVIDIFNYENYRDSQECIDNLRTLGVGFTEPCPYCNCNPLSIVMITPNTPQARRERALLDLDHFFAKSRYPFLAVSLFNLIPSCHNCNSRFKGKKVFALNTHIHPFSEAFDQLFKFELITPYLDGQTADDLKIRCVAKPGATFPPNSIVDLNLVARHEAHRPQLITMLEYLNKDPYGNMAQFFSAADIAVHKKAFYNMGQIPLNRQEISKCTVGKMKVDLHDEFLQVNTP